MRSGWPTPRQAHHTPTTPRPPAIPTASASIPRPSPLCRPRAPSHSLPLHAPLFARSWQPGEFELTVRQAAETCAGSSSAVMPLDVGLSQRELERYGQERSEVTLHAAGDTCGMDSLIPPHDSPDALYALTLPVAADLDIHTCARDGSTDFETVLRLVSGCYSSGQAVEIAHIGRSHLDHTCHDGMTGAAFVASVPAGEYTVVVTSEASQCGRYALSVGVTPAPTAATSADGDQSGGTSRRPMAARAPPADADRHAHAGGQVSQAHCTCEAEWQYLGTTYYGCDARKPSMHGAWCPVVEEHCGKQMHRAERVRRGRDRRVARPIAALIRMHRSRSRTPFRHTRSSARSPCAPRYRAARHANRRPVGRRGVLRLVPRCRSRPPVGAALRRRACGEQSARLAAGRVPRRWGARARAGGCSDCARSQHAAESQRTGRLGRPQHACPRAFAPNVRLRAPCLPSDSEPEHDDDLIASVFRQWYCMSLNPHLVRLTAGPHGDTLTLQVAKL
jgi:hypothetical protein